MGKVKEGVSKKRKQKRNVSGLFIKKTEAEGDVYSVGDSLSSDVDYSDGELADHWLDNFARKLKAKNKLKDHIDEQVKKIVKPTVGRASYHGTSQSQQYKNAAQIRAFHENVSAEVASKKQKLMSGFIKVLNQYELPALLRPREIICLDSIEEEYNAGNFIIQH
jgi:hypothetical protein